MRRAAFLTAVLVLVIFASSAFGQKALVRVYFDDLEHLKAVISEFDDVAGRANKRYADIVVPAERMSEFKSLAPNHEILIPDIDRHMADRGILEIGSAFHTYEEVNAEMGQHRSPLSRHMQG